MLTAHAHAPFVHSQGSLLSMVGRGYSDFTASIIAECLKAETLEIWKDVDGIFTADPAKVATARLLPKISLDELGELAYYGSQVVHPFSIEQVPIQLVSFYLYASHGFPGQSGRDEYCHQKYHQHDGTGHSHKRHVEL